MTFLYLIDVVVHPL